MPRPRTPTALLELRGSFKRNPSRGRDRADEPRPINPFPKAPGYFTEDQKLLWKEMAERGSWLTGPDQFMACIAIVLLDKHRRRAIDYKEIPQLISVLSFLGFTPKDRARMKVEKARNEQPMLPSSFP